MTDLSPASQQLLRELARRDQGDGVAVRYASRGRWYLDGPSSSKHFNTRTFPPLYDADLALGWDEHDDDGPMRITDAGRKLAGELEAQAAEREAAKRARPKASASGRTAQRLLREIANREQPARIYGDMRRRRVWHLDSHDGFSAMAETWLALSGADLIHIEYGFAGGKRVSMTEAGRKHIA